MAGIAEHRTHDKVGPAGRRRGERDLPLRGQHAARGLQVDGGGEESQHGGGGVAEEGVIDVDVDVQHPGLRAPHRQNHPVGF
jgi:hypothetical protein